MKTCVVLASGRGSNFRAILANVQKGELPLQILALISDDPQAQALVSAREAGLEAVALDFHSFAEKAAYRRRLLEVLQGYDPDYVLLAGYMRVLDPAVIRAFPRRIINIHPSLLPAFPGLHGQRQALEYGVKIAGCTVHYVDEGMDTGEIIAQRAVAVLPGDTEESLSARILAEEHKLYSEVLQELCATKE